MKGKAYLGGGVYVEDTIFHGVRLTTEDGISVTNEIYLEFEILDLLFEYCVAARHAREQGEQP